MRSKAQMKTRLAFDPDAMTLDCRPPTRVRTVAAPQPFSRAELFYGVRRADSSG